MEIQKVPVAKAEMLIRRPVAEVFAAFVNPEVTGKFWFSKGSGPLEAGKKVRWDWEMYGHSVEVDVKAIEPNERIEIEWMSYDSPTKVEWTFTQRPDNTTFVSVINSGFTGNGDTLVQHAIESTEGFALALASAKALLEHKIQLNLIPDRFPDAVVKGWAANK